MFLIWHRTLLRRLFINFLWLFISAIFFVCLIDYSLKLGSTDKEFYSLIRKYAQFLITEFGTIVPICGFIASFIVTHQIVEKKEFMSMVTSGYSPLKSCTPFLLFSLFCVFLVWGTQNVAPLLSKKHSKQQAICCIPLPNQKALICHKEGHTDVLHDLYLIDSPHKIYYMDTLSFQENKLTATNLFTLVKKEKDWHVSQTEEKKILPFQIPLEILYFNVIVPAQLNWRELIKSSLLSGPQMIESATHLAYRSYLLVATLFLVLLPPLYAFKFSRSLSWTLFLVFHLLMILFLRIVSRSIVNLAPLPTYLPAIALLTLAALLLIITTYRYARL